jgi:putrescine importer
VGAIWLAVGVIYGAIRTKGFRSDLVQFEVPAED